MPDHRVIDARSLHFGRLIADRISAEPGHIDRAEATLSRWMETCSPRTRATLEEWMTILNGPMDGVLAVLTGTDERATRLRQSNPFTGVLTQAERNDIIRQFWSHDTAASFDQG